MVANTATMSLNASEIALDMAGRMEVLAANGDWDQVKLLAARIKYTLLEIPEAERAEVMQSVNRALERVKTVALTSRHDVAEKLTEIRRGRSAARAYGRSSGGLATTVLR